MYRNRTGEQHVLAADIETRRREQRPEPREHADAHEHDEGDPAGLHRSELWGEESVAVTMEECSVQCTDCGTYTNKHGDYEPGIRRIVSGSYCRPSCLLLIAWWCLLAYNLQWRRAEVATENYSTCWYVSGSSKAVGTSQ